MYIGTTIKLYKPHLNDRLDIIMIGQWLQSPGHGET